jgi:ankyrin repeat protein
MYFPKASYLKILVLLTLSGLQIQVCSQEIVSDTNQYYAILRGSDAQSNLDYALFQAASQGNILGIDWLLRHGAMVDASTMEYVTPVIFAVASREKEALMVLLKYHPDLNVVSAYNESALMVAVKNNDMEIAELLLRDSAEVNLQDRHGFTALHLSSAFGYLDMTDMLLYYDADVNIKSRDGITPLMVATYSGYADITDILLQNRARVSDADAEGFTPLMLAAQNGDTLIIDLLLNRGADIKAVNKYKYDALDLAIMMNYPEAVEYILRRTRKDAGQGNNTINPYLVASAYRRKDMIDLLRKNEIPESQSRGFDLVSFTVSGKFCLHDIYTGFSISAREARHNTGFFAGFDLKPSWTRVLVEENEKSYIQYMDKSYLAYAGILKELNLTNNVIRGNWFFTGSLAAGYSFGNEFRGTALKPESKLKIIPAAGFRYNKNAFNFLINLEYTNTDFYKIGPVWIRTGVSFDIELKNVKGSAKVIKW